MHRGWRGLSDKPARWFQGTVVIDEQHMPSSLEAEATCLHWKLGSQKNLAVESIVATGQVGVMGHLVYVLMVVMMINGSWYQGRLRPRS
jgi:hypothetical protein